MNVASLLPIVGFFKHAKHANDLEKVAKQATNIDDLVKGINKIGGIVDAAGNPILIKKLADGSYEMIDAGGKVINKIDDMPGLLEQMGVKIGKGPEVPKDEPKPETEGPRNQIPTGDEIYTLLDDGTEFGGLFIQMQMDENLENEAKWDCIVDAVSFVNKQAYIFEGARYLPAPIENVDDELIIHFLDGFYSINPENKNIGEDFLEHIMNTDTITKKDMVSYFNEYFA